MALGYGPSKTLSSLVILGSSDDHLQVFFMCDFTYLYRFCQSPDTCSEFNEENSHKAVCKTP